MSPTPNPPSADPFTLVFNELWSLAEASVPLTALVKPGNLIKYNKAQDRSPIKEEIAVADMPELLLTSVGTSDIKSHSSSCGSGITRQYQWLLTTGDFRINFKLYPVQWALFAAVIAGESAIAALKWNNKPFVTRMMWSGLSEGLSNAELNRGIKGWSSLWTFQIEMNFTTADLLRFTQGI
jgi:hypothetical protein